MKDLLSLSQEIAVELSILDTPHIWTARQNPGAWWTHLYTGDAWLHLNIDRSGKRLIVTASRPRELLTSGETESYTYAMTRTPEDMARAIARQNVPNARAHFAACLAWTRQNKERKRAHAETLHSLEPFARWKRTDSNGQRTDLQTETARLDVICERVNEIRINNPTLDQAMRILRMLEEPRR